MTINKELQDFLEYLEYNKRYSKDTIKSYKNDLGNFNMWIKTQKIKNLDDITLKDLRRYVRTFAHLSSASINRKISSLGTFFAYLCTEDICEHNIALLLRNDRPKNEKKIMNIISNEELEKTINLAKSKTVNGNKTSYRDYAIIKFFAETGVRCAELSNILINDIDFINQCVIIKGKGNKERVVYIKQDLIDVLNYYMYNTRKSINDCHLSDYLFLSQKGGKMNTYSIETAINKLMEQAGTKEQGRSCHTLRKSFATNSYEKTGDIYVVASMLGHENIETTKIYAKQSQDRIKQAFLL